MKTAKDVTLVGMFTALLIGSQLALYTVTGVEVVTVLFLCFCAVYGRGKGVLVALAFSLLRCFIFGFQLNVILLYLVYYTAFALAFGGLRGKHLPLLAVVGLACVSTVAFTLLDDILTPLVLGFSPKAAKFYFYGSLYAMGVQTACTAITVSVLYLPLSKLLHRISEA